MGQSVRSETIISNLSKSSVSFTVSSSLSPPQIHHANVTTALESRDMCILRRTFHEG